jgi:radical SAM superfamily enzyme YgiQ (UPF0313 family)
MNLPPFGAGVVAGHLRSNDVPVDLRDLNSVLWRMHLGGEIVAADLRPFYEAQTVIDYVRGGENEYLDTFAARLLRDIRVEDCDVVGASAGGDFSWLELHTAAVVAAHIQRHYGKPIIFGGNNIEYIMQFKEPFDAFWQALLDTFTAIVNGPGEDVFLDLATQLVSGRTALPMVRPGLVYRSGGHVRRPPDGARRILPPDFDGLELADYHNFVRHRPQGTPKQQRIDEAWNLTQVFRWPPALSWLGSETNSARVGDGVVGKLVMPYVFNYNCPYNCAFCTESLDQIKLVHAKADQVIEHMVGLMDKYDTEYIYLFNNYFNLLNGFVEEFASRVVLGGVKLNWSDCARFNSLTYESLAMLADGGCRRLTFGMETASTKMLKIIDKRVKLAEAEQVLRWCKEVGIWADLEIITGLPHEDLDEFAQTEDFLRRNAEYINYFNINRYFIAPRSLMGADPVKYGMAVRPDPNAYQKLLDANYRWMSDPTRTAPRPQNFRVYEFDEIGGRPAEQVAVETEAAIARLNEIQNADFMAAYRVMNLRGKRPSTPPLAQQPSHPMMTVA